MPRFTVTEATWSGVPALRLSDDEAQTAALLVPGLGGNLISLTDRGDELLRTAPDARSLREKPARWGIPVLMPPNRIVGGRFRFNGREYQLELTDSSGLHHNHGFPLRRAWQVATTGADGGASATIRFAAADHPDVMAQFPHPFVLELTYTLTGRSLRCRPVVRNPGDEPMPFGLGFHPYFLAPEGEEVFVRLTPGRLWEMTDWLPTGRFHEPHGVYDLSTWQPAHAATRGEGYRVTDPEPDGRSRFELANRTTGRTLALRAAPAYRHWLIFNGFAGSFSAEPYTCMTNAFNLDLDPAVSGMDALAPGEERRGLDWELTWTDRAR
ncbi:aldose 1-epimerase [Symbiobacterium terraclitae]|uniref:aldose 1-epimerase n=1 Tax=Symbiobacterium terraclitae TaxID=557451 RepID=UPI0035B54A0A